METDKTDPQLPICKCAFGSWLGLLVTSTLLLEVTDHSLQEECLQEAEPVYESAGSIILFHCDSSDWPRDVHVTGEGPIRALPWNFSTLS